MASYSPTIIINANPALQVSSTNVTYNEIRESLASSVYKVQKFYLSSPFNINQIQEPYTYQHFDSNGNQIVETLIFPIDPYQKQAAIFQTEKDRNIIFDSRASLSFVMQPLTSIKITLFYIRINIPTFLDEFHDSNFVQVEKGICKFKGANSDYNFFDGLVDIIPDI
jgi:hypothetical protein